MKLEQTNASHAMEERQRNHEPPIRETYTSISPLQLIQDQMIYGTMNHRGLQPMGAPAGDQLARPASCLQVAGPINH